MIAILKNHASAPITRKRLSAMSSEKKEANQNEFVKKGGVPDRVESFLEINSGEDCPRVRPGYVKPIRNGLKKKQNLIKSRLSRGETDLAGRENRNRLQKGE